MTGAKIKLPAVVFLYTMDQIATMINVAEESLRQSYVHYDGRSTGPCPKDRMLAYNIAPQGERPEWRVSDKAFRRWLRLKGFKYYERGIVE